MCVAMLFLTGSTEGHLGCVKWKLMFPVQAHKPGFNLILIGTKGLPADHMPMHGGISLL